MTITAPAGGVTRMSRRVMNLSHLLTQNARRHGDRIGFVWGEKSWTWRAIDVRVSALAAALAARGIVKGDRILVHSRNCDEMFWSMFAAFRLGAVWVPTNFRLMPDEVTYLATASGAKAFLCHGDFPDHAAAVEAASPGLAFTWRIGEGAFGERSVSDAIAARAGAGVEEAGVEYDDPCWFFFTSGTTGRSKAAVLTHGQMAFVVTNHLADLIPGTTENDDAGGGNGYRPVDHSDAFEVMGGVLSEALRAGWLPKITNGWFFRAETFFSVARYLDQAGSSSDFLSYSHGEGFLRFFEERCQRQGIFIFDEPESALSPSRQMEFLKLMRRMEASTICQVVMATHSPMLMAYPNARLLRLSKYSLDPVTVEQTDHYSVMREFCNDPVGFVEAVID
jgi:predicted ATPase